MREVILLDEPGDFVLEPPNRVKKDSVLRPRAPSGNREVVHLRVTTLDLHSSGHGRCGGKGGRGRGETQAKIGRWSIDFPSGKKRRGGAGLFRKVFKTHFRLRGGGPPSRYSGALSYRKVLSARLPGPNPHHRENMENRNSLHFSASFTCVQPRPDTRIRETLPRPRTAGTTSANTTSAFRWNRKDPRSYINNVLGPNGSAGQHYIYPTMYARTKPAVARPTYPLRTFARQHREFDSAESNT